MSILEIVPSNPTLRVKCPNCGAAQTPEFSLCAQCGCRMSRPADAPTRVSSPGHPRMATPSISLASLPRPTDQAEPPAIAEPHGGPDPLIGFVVAGRYRIVARIGRGGMGVVYKVEHIELGKLLAVKLLTGELASDRQVVRRFKREALLASRLSHPNTVQVFDYGYSDGLSYLVMELVFGHDLSWILAHEGPLPFERVARLIVQVCSSLAEAHRLGITHRDMKPANIMVARTMAGEELAKVLDFGLAKLREAPELGEVTGGGAVVGTPIYMAPEQIMGRAVDGRTDIYSLGAVMYRLLTGTPPFQNTPAVSVFACHLHDEPQPPHLRNPGANIPQRVSEIVLRALEKKPSSRYQRVEELQDDLLTLITEEGATREHSLLNPSSLRRLDAEVMRSATVGDGEAESARLAVPLLRKGIATRDEVEAFKRRLAMQRYVGIGVLVLVAGVVGFGGVRAWRTATTPPAFDGWEREPNNLSTQATPVPFGQSIRAYLGKRIDQDRSDRDFFKVTIPPGAGPVAIRTSSLPNMATCTLLYKNGEAEASARFCMGRPATDLVVRLYHVEPGEWLLGVMQDRERYGAMEAPAVVENVSDSYAFSVTSDRPEPEWESEPNDLQRAADEVLPGGVLRGALAWAQDVDFICAAAGDATERVQWLVQDGETIVRERGTVLEVTPIDSMGSGVPVRVHGTHAKAGQVDAQDVMGPWRSEPFASPTVSTQKCVRLRLTTDPWAGPGAPPAPAAGNEPWEIRLEAVP